MCLCLFSVWLLLGFSCVPALVLQQGWWFRLPCLLPLVCSPRAVAQPPAGSTMHSGSGPARCGTGPRAVGDALLELPARTPVCSCWFVLLVGFPIFARGGGQKSENRRARRTSLDTQGVRAGSSRRASSGARGPVLRRAGLEQECIMDAAGGSATARGRTHQSQEARQPERVVILIAAAVSLLFRCRAAVSLLFRCRVAVSLLFRCPACRCELPACRCERAGPGKVRSQVGPARSQIHITIHL